MDSILTIIIFLFGIAIGSLITFFFTTKRKNHDEVDSLSDVKDLVKDLSNKISIKEGKDEERYDMVNRLTSLAALNYKAQLEKFCL